MPLTAMAPPTRAARIRALRLRSMDGFPSRRRRACGTGPPPRPTGGGGEPVRQQPRVRAAASADVESAPTPKPNNNRLNINVHLDPGAILGKKDSNGGYNKTISIPTFGSLGAKLANKTIGSETGFFGVKTGTGARRKRESDLGSIDTYRWVRKLDEIMKVVKYDPSVREFVAKFENKTLVCQIGSKMPDTVSKVMRSCVPNVISDCPHDEAANKVCQSYTQLVHDTNAQKAYRNIDCAKCNGVDRKNATLKGCLMSTRTTGAGSLWGVEGKGNQNNEACDDPVLAEKFC